MTLIKREDATEGGTDAKMLLADAHEFIDELPSAEAEPKRVLQGYCKGANTIQTIRHEELTQIANTRKAVESADAVHGEWIDRIDGGRIKYPWWENCECNQCGEYGSGAYNYCPNCGARMKGGAE